jgi:chromosome segregation ATPase
MTMTQPSQHAIDAAHYILCGLGPSDAQERNAIEAIQHAIDAACAELRANFKQCSHDAEVVWKQQLAEKDAEIAQLNAKLNMIDVGMTTVNKAAGRVLAALDQRNADQAALISRLEQRLREAEARLVALMPGM